MLFRTQGIAIVSLILAYGLPLLGQDQTASSEKQAYREMLRANAEDGQSTQGADSAAAREAYKKRLRELSGDGSAAEQSEQRETVPSVNNSSNETHASTSPQTDQSASGQEDSSFQPVSTEIPSSDQKTPTSASPVAVVPQGANSCDSYCKRLRDSADGQASAPPSSPAELTARSDGREFTTERTFVRNLAFDQLNIWQSPFKLRASDATWAVPFGIVTGALVATDRDVSKEAATPNRLDVSKTISDAGLLTFVGAGAGFYGLGLMTHDDHKRETGLLSGEAAINAALTAEALKLMLGRQRPFEGDGFGHIGKGGSSFPSEHAMLSWAIASVVAREYPNPIVEIGAYGLASAVAVSRVTAGQHFPSDVFVGSTLGYLIGRKIYKDHHNPELGGAEYGTFVRERNYDADHSGSAYVPLESWVYPVIDRLAGLGLVHSNFDSERPWTRLECARIAAEASQSMAYDDQPTNVREMVDSLQHEFSPEFEVWRGGSSNRSAELESVYTRVTDIAGPALRDGYHFGQTLYNDYGRPYGQGVNNITGFSARATSGPLVFYFRGEYQHAPGNPNYTPEQKTQIQFLADDGTPQVDNRFPAVDRFRVLDAYLGLNFAGNQLTLGQQSLWWGPGTGGPFMFTNNAEPLKMIRLSSVSPIEVPLLSKFLGPLRYDMFLGQTDGYHYILTPQGLLGPHVGTQPFVQGQRFTFKPTPNLEFGLTKTGVFGGSGYPLTAVYLLRTTITTANTDPGATRKPGDRRSGFDLTYRIPKLRDWMTWYAEEFNEDEVSPLLFPRTSAMRSGIYVARFPHVPNVDLRVEGVYTDVPNYPAHGFFYFNATYRDGFTDNGNLMGDWIGRQGRGVNAASTVWWSSTNSLQVGYREGVVASDFLQGGRYQDEFVKATFDVRKNLSIGTLLQYENWHFPFLSPSLQSNVTSSVQITYQPKWKK